MSEETALQNKKVSLGRHPLLAQGTLSNNVYNYLKREPGKTIGEIAKNLGEKYQSINGCLQRMKAHGLIITQYGQRGNRTIVQYFSVTENEGGFARDRVRFEVTVYVNEFGEYSIKAKVINESPLSHEGDPKPVHTAEFYVAVPKPTEPYKTRQIFHNERNKVVESLLIDLTPEKL